MFSKFVLFALDVDIFLLGSSNSSRIMLKYKCFPPYVTFALTSLHTYDLYGCNYCIEYAISKTALVGVVYLSRLRARR